MSDALLNELTQREYQHGFVTDVATESIPAGLSEDVVRIISRNSGEESTVSRSLLAGS